MARHAAVPLVAILVVVAGGGERASAQGCVEPPSLGRAYAWPQGQSVKVNISPDFDAALTAAIRDAFGNWANAGGSGVGFSFTQEPASIGGTYVVQVDRDYPSQSNWRAETGGNIQPGGNRLTAWMKFHPALTDYAVMLSAASHEVGHTFGLDDCYSCPLGTSAMTVVPSFNDSTSALAYPSPCDNSAAQKNAGYTTPPGPGPGPGPGPAPRPPSCVDCIVLDCIITQVCTRDATGESCGPEELYCDHRSGCCRTDAAAASEADPCGEWQRADGCEFGSVCCVDPAIASQPPTCASRGWWDQGAQSECQAACGHECTETTITAFSSTGQTSTNYCWQCEPQSCEAMGGDYCSQSGSCPAGSDSLGQSADCNPCCRTCASSGCPADSCGWQLDNCGNTIWCGSCLPSCGAMGGDYCSQSGSCPPGYDNLGQSWDCTPCCRQGPSCGAIGGDYCSQSGGCPSDYVNLGETWDCHPCCQYSCSPQGCSPGSCDWQPDGCGGWNWCGNCDPCGGDPCCGDPCCGDPCCGDPCCGDPCCGDPCCGDPCCGDACIP